MRIKNLPKYTLSSLFLMFLLPAFVHAATFNFNTMYKGAGTSYGLNTNSITNISPIIGTSIQFYQAGAQFSGNSINGVLTYYDNNHILQTIYGNLNRQDKSGSTSLSFYFLVANSTYTSFTGEAYLFVVPGKESYYTTGATVTTSSDPMAAALNAVVASINSITLSSAAGTDSQTACLGTAITSITYTTTGATGATFSGLPSGVSGNWSSNKVTISGTPSVTGTFNYNVTLTGGTGSGTANGTILVKPTNTITLSSGTGTDAQSINVNTAINSITYTTTGATGASVSGLPSGVTGTWTNNVFTISGTPTITGTFNFTVTLSGGCGVVTKTGTIVVNAVGSNSITLSSGAGTDAQTVCNNTSIANITYATTGATGATFTGLPAGVNGSWAANVVTITGTPTSAGTFNYTVTLTGGVGNVFKSGTINVAANNTISLSSATGTDAQTPVVNTAITNITYNTTGATGASVTGLPTGVTGSWAANVFTISGTPTGSVTTTSTYNYTITLTGGCGVVSTTGHMDVNPAGSNTIVLTSATGTDAQTICSNTAINSITYSTTGATGATITGLPAGITGAWVSNVVSISGTPIGTITNSTVYAYKVTLTGGIGAVEANGTITVNPASVAGTVTGGGVTVCSGTNTTTLTLSGNAGSIQWQSSNDNNTFYDIAGATNNTLLISNIAANTYYKANITNGSCSTVATGTVTITVDPVSVAGTIGGSASVCSGTNTTTLTLTGSTGTIQWQSSTDNISFANISGATSATYTATNKTVTTYYRTLVTSGTCSTATSGTASITVSPLSVSGTISGGGVSVCSGTNSTLLTLNGNTGTIQWQSSTDNITFANISGATSATYTVTNITATTYYRALVTSGACSTATTGTATITVTVCSVIVPDVNATNVKVPVTGNLTTNDVTSAGSTYGQPAPNAANPAGATITVGSNGTYTFTAILPGKYIYYVPVCSAGQSSGCPLSPLQITVLDPSVNTNLPVANNDVANTPLNTPITINVLANDKSGNATTSLVASTVTVTTQPVNGTIAVNANGTVVYTPNTGFVGKDSLTYNVCDNGSPSNCQVAVAYITIKATSVTPYTTAADDYATIPAGGVATGNVLTNDITSGVSSLTASLVTGPTAAQGTFTINANGTYTFTPTAGFNGPVDIVYQACDGLTPANCAMATLHILVTPPPVLVPDVNATNVGVPVVGNLSTNDVTLAGTTYGQPAPNAANPLGATITVGPNGTYTFTATKPGKYVYYVPVCGVGQSSGCPLSPLEITVLNPNVINNLPVANNDAANTALNTAVTLNVLANDKSGNATTALLASTVSVTTQPANGTIVVNVDGTVKYTPSNGFVGKDSLIYKVCDNGSPANCQFAVAYVTVKATGSLPATIATDDYAAIPTGGIATGNLLTNDITSSVSSLTASLVTGPTAAQGTITINANGTYTFTPTAGFSGPVDIVYQACDGSTPANCAKATLHILVTPPTLLPDLNVTNINVPVAGNLSTNDIITGTATYGQPAANAANPTGATITVGPNGTYTFTATLPGKYIYMVPVCSIGQTTGCPLVPLEITALSPSITTNGPVANNDLANTLVNTPVKLYVLANDGAGNLTTALAASTLTITVQPANGIAILNPDTTLKYTPNPGFIGRDSLVYRICDDGYPANCQTAVVYINVKPIADAPYTIATDDYTQITTGMVATGLLLVNDINSSNATLTASLITGPTAAQGTISIKGDGSYTFTPTAGFSGPVDIVYQACDTASPAVCAKATLHILVTPLSGNGTGNIAQNFIDLSKTVTAVAMNLDGSFNISFKIKIKNNTNAVLTNVSIKDDLKNVFPKYNGVKVISNTVSGKLVKNPSYDGINNIDLLNNTSSTLDPFKTDSVLLVINVQNGSFGNFQNVAIGGVHTIYGDVSTISYDPRRRISITDTTSLPSLFVVPQLGITIEPAFSPNNDGFNDTWVIVRPYGTNVSVRVFNRWGNVVYSNGNYQNDWRGKGQMNFLGEDVPEGTYFYVVEVTDQINEIRKFAGSLTIVR